MRRFTPILFSISKSNCSPNGPQPNWRRILHLRHRFTHLVSSYTLPPPWNGMMQQVRLFTVHMKAMEGEGSDSRQKKENKKINLSIPCLGCALFVASNKGSQQEMTRFCHASFKSIFTTLLVHENCLLYQMEYYRNKNWIWVLLEEKLLLDWNWMYFVRLTLDRHRTTSTCATSSEITIRLEYQKFRNERVTYQLTDGSLNRLFYEPNWECFSNIIG